MRGRRHFLHRAPCMALKLGMCGFTIGAASYVKQFPVVEVQQTFYDARRVGDDPRSTAGVARDGDPVSMSRELSRHR